MDTTRTGGDWFTHGHWLGNTPLSWVIAACGAVVGLAVAHTVLVWARHLVERRAQRTRRVATRSVAAALGAVRTWLLVLLAIVIPLSLLTFPDRAGYWLHLATFLLVGLQVVLCVNRVIVTWLLRSVQTDPPTEMPVMLGILTWTFQFAVWVTFLLALLTSAGVNITAFVASLGIGGIAIALALQNVLGDLFASVAIGLDKPFEPGEFIAFGDDSGTVKRVGVKTTRIVSVTGEQLAISNSKLLSLLIHNYSRMPERRVSFGFTVPYDTDRQKLREIVERTRTIVTGEQQVRYDRGHLTGFGAGGFAFEFVYYVLDSDDALHLDIQQRIGEQAVDMLDSLGVSFGAPAA